MCKEQKSETACISEEELEDIEKIDIVNVVNVDDVFFDKNDFKDYSTEDGDDFK